MLANYVQMVGSDSLQRRLLCVYLLVWVLWSVDDIFIDVWQLINNFEFASIPLRRALGAPYPHEQKFDALRK